MGEWIFGKQVIEYSMGSQPIVQFLHANHDKFDLVIAELYTLELAYFLSVKHNAPIVLVSAFDIEYPVFESLGTFSIWSHIPLLSHFSDQTNGFFERLWNRFLSFLYTKIRLSSHTMPLEHRMPNQVAGFPGIRDIEAQASLVMLNSLQILSHSKMEHPGVIDISGIQFKKNEFMVDNLKVKFRFIFKFVHLIFDFSEIFRRSH